MDGKYCISGSRDESVIVWSLETGEVQQKLEGHTGPVNSVCLSADGKYCISGSTDEFVIVWSLDGELK